MSDELKTARDEYHDRLYSALKKRFEERKKQSGGLSLARMEDELKKIVDETTTEVHNELVKRFTKTLEIDIDKDTGIVNIKMEFPILTQLVE